jgi:hypothetical protein
MTYSADRYDNYINQGQQDDYFDRDLAIAGHEPKVAASQENQALEEYKNQGQQDDYFYQNPPIENQALEEYKIQGQQDDYFDQDLSKGDRAST